MLPVCVPNRRVMKRFKVAFRNDYDGKAYMLVYARRHDKRRFNSKPIPGVWSYDLDNITDTLSVLVMLYMAIFVRQPWEIA